MTLEEKLNDFITQKESHTFLLYGPWGVGKTFSLQQWINDKVKNTYKLINLSLFGVSSVNELNALALNSECLRNKIFSHLKNINQDVSLGINNINVSIPLIGIVSAFLKEKHNKKAKYLFILDDIERKDNKLTIEEVLGFVDSLPKENTKVVLVANLDKLDNLESFKGFKEKVIQEEFCLEYPMSYAVENIIGMEYAKHFISNSYPIKNLRTLIKIKKIVEKLNKPVDYSLLDCIYYCCLNIYENQVNKDYLLSEYEKDKSKYIKMYYDLRRDEYNGRMDEELNKISEYVNKLKFDWEYVYEIVKLKGLLNAISENNLKAFVKEVFELIKNEDYVHLNNLNIPLRKTPLKMYNEQGNSVFYSGEPNQEYEKIMYNFFNCFKSDNYELIDLFRNYSYTIISCNDLVSKKSKGKQIEKQINKLCIKKVSQYIFDNSYYSDDELKPLNIIKNIPDWLIDLETKMLESYYNIFNYYYLSFSKNNKLDWKDINQHLLAAKSVFRNLDIFDEKKFKIDLITINVLKNISISLKGNLNEDDWSYCHSFVEWISKNKNKFDFDKSIQYINQNASLKNILGYRFSILAKQYGLMKQKN